MSATRSTASARPVPPAERRRPGEGRERDRGTAYVGTLVGSAIFILFLLLGAQTLIHLFASSAVSAAAFDAAEAVATDPDAMPQEIPVAESQARLRLGGLGRRASFRWEEADADQVVLEVSVRSPGFLPFSSSLLRVDRTVVVRTETFR